MYTSTPERSGALEGEVPYPRTQHRDSDVPRPVRGETSYLSEILHQAGIELTLHKAIIAKHHVLTIGPRPPLLSLIDWSVITDYVCDINSNRVCDHCHS